MTLSTIFQFLPRNFLNKNILISVLGLLFVGFVSVMFSEPVEEYIGPVSGLSHQKNEILTFLGVGMGGVLLTLFRKYMMIFLMIFLISILGLFFVGFVSVMFSVTFEQRVGPLLGLSEQKNEILTFLGIGMGGLLVALQALMSYIRAKAMEDTAKQQVIANQNTQQGLQQERLRTDETAKAQARANENTENGLRQERLKNAIEHLGNDSDSVRLGGAYELFHLAQDTKKEALQRMRSSGGADERFHLAQDTPDLRQTVLDILCAHIRRTTGEDEYRKTHQSKPSEEVQSLLTLLFVQKHDVFEGLHINLQESFLDGANLTGAYLEMAILSKAQLNGADLRDARLHGVNFWKAQLQGANLGNANLRGIDLRESYLHGANLGGVRLHGAKLSNAGLRGACLMETQLQGARLLGAQLQGASLMKAQLQGAYLSGAELQGTESQSGSYIYFRFNRFADRMWAAVDRESDLSGATFEGGLRLEDVPSIVKGLSDIIAEDSRVIANDLQEKLAPHIGMPASHELPENSGAKIGAYTEEEAEEWIAKYEKITAHIPTAME